MLVASLVALAHAGPLVPTLPPAGRPATWPADGCRRSMLRMGIAPLAQRSGGVTWDGDLDGDGRPDRLHLEESGGSGAASSALTLVFATGERVELAYLVSFSNILTRVPVPPGMSPAARRAVEDALWDTICATPDPSLEALLEPGRVRWRPGPAMLPPLYVLATEDEWLVYLGHVHAGLDHRPGGTEIPRVLAQQGGVQILASAHGVYAEWGGRHAWLYVAAGQDKLRWPTPLTARFVGPRQVEIVEHPRIPGATPPVVAERRL